MSEEKQEKEREIDLKSAEELRAFLRDILDKTADGTSAPIYSMTAINYVMNLPNVYDLLDQENKELARDIWLHLKQAGLQLREPTLLFDPPAE